MARTTDSDDPRLLARVTARVLRDGAQALYRDPALFDQLYRRRRRDVQFYLDCARRYGGPVLELGAGNGRVAIALARAGIDVVGVDAMASMLTAARARAAEPPAKGAARARFVRGDLRSVRLGRRFPLVIAPFNTFMHLYARRDFERALATCRVHLRPRGRLVFDVMMPDLRALLQDPERLYACPPLRHPSDGTRYRLREASHYDPVTQLRSLTMVLENEATPRSAGAMPRPKAASSSPAPALRGGAALTKGIAGTALPLVHRQWFPAELEALLHYNGFELEARFGDFDGAALGAASEVQITVARMRGRR